MGDKGAELEKQDVKSLEDSRFNFGRERINQTKAEWLTGEFPPNYRS